MYDISTLFFLTHTLFISSLAIFLNRGDNIFIMFLLTELMGLSGIINYVIYSYWFSTFDQSLVLVFFSLGAAEAAIGLTLIINFVKLQNNLSLF